MEQSLIPPAPPPKDEKYLRRLRRLKAKKTKDANTNGHQETPQKRSSASSVLSFYSDNLTPVQDPQQRTLKESDKRNTNQKQVRFSQVIEQFTVQPRILKGDYVTDPIRRQGAFMESGSNYDMSIELLRMLKERDEDKTSWSRCKDEISAPPSTPTDGSFPGLPLLQRRPSNRIDSYSDEEGSTQSRLWLRESMMSCPRSLVESVAWSLLSVSTCSVNSEEIQNWQVCSAIFEEEEIETDHVSHVIVEEVQSDEKTQTDFKDQQPRSLDTTEHHTIIETSKSTQMQSMEIDPRLMEEFANLDQTVDQITSSTLKGTNASSKHQRAITDKQQLSEDPSTVVKGNQEKYYFMTFHSEHDTVSLSIPSSLVKSVSRVQETVPNYSILNHIETKLKRWYAERIPDRPVFRYRDEEGDEIRIVSDDDLMAAFKWTCPKGHGRISLRMTNG